MDFSSKSIFFAENDQRRLLCLCVFFYGSQSLFLLQRVQRRDEFVCLFSSFLDVYTNNAKRKNDILEKRSFGCTSSEVDESQTSSKKDDLHEELMENV